MTSLIETLIYGFVLGTGLTIGALLVLEIAGQREWWLYFDGPKELWNKIRAKVNRRPSDEN